MRASRGDAKHVPLQQLPQQGVLLPEIGWKRDQRAVEEHDVGFGFGGHFDKALQALTERNGAMPVLAKRQVMPALSSSCGKP